MTCQWINQCPYYEVQTSYGTEEIKCANTDCIMYERQNDEEGEEE